MATNKRKDAAALFELIDKSTLKVPKHAGALKIPDWWSSKNNPVATADVGKGTASESAIPEAKSAVVQNGPALPGDAATPAASQPRLFEPPPPGTVPSISPSIRPPVSATPASASNGTTRPSVLSPASSSHAGSSAGGPPTSPRETSSNMSAERGARLFAPQTMDQSNRPRQAWAGQHKRRMARAPKWAVLGGLALAVLLIALVALGIWYARGRASTNSGGRSAPQQETQNAGDGMGSAAVPLLPPSGGRPTMPMPASPAAQGGSDQTPVSPEPDVPPVAGKVYGPRTVTRAPELYYVVISSTPAASVAQKNAEFLAAHGIDVSIEIVAGPGGGGANTRWFKIISVQGFPSVVAGEPYRKRIVLIGHQHPDFHNHKKVWDDAFLSHVTTVASK